MDFSCIILTWNSERFVAKCLETLFAELVGSSYTYEVFVVDNGSMDGTGRIIQAFEEKYPKVLCPIYLKRNMGTTYSRNVALRRSRGNYIILMDSDVEVNPGILKGSIQTFNGEKRIGLVAPKLEYPDGSFQKSTDYFPSLSTKAWRFLFLKAMESRESRLNSKESIHEVDCAISAFWMVKKEAFERVGLLDENIFYSPEDVDFCLRLWKGGYRVMYNPEVTAVHHAQELSRGFRIRQATIHHIRGLIYYFRKHGYLFRRPVVR